MATENEQYDDDPILDREPVNENGEDHYQETYEEDSLHKLLIDLGGETDAEMRIYKQPGDGRSKMAYLFAASPGDYTYGQLLEKVKNEYGGGDYRIHVRQDKRIVVNRQFSVAEVKQSEQSSNSDQNMNLLQERFENKLEKIQSDNMRMFERLIDSLSNQNQGPSPAEMQKQTMEMLVQMKELTSDEKKGKEKSSLEQLKELMEVQALMKDSMPSDREPASGDILLNAISQFGPAFQRLMGQQDQNGQTQTGQLPAPQNQPPQNPPQNPGEQPQTANQQENGEANPQNENIQALGQHLQVLLMAAQQNGDPVSYANVVMDFTDEANIRKIHDFLSQDDCVEQLAQAFPQMAEHFQSEQVYNWFHELRSELISLIRTDYPDLQPAPEPVTTTGEDANSGNSDDHGDGATDGDSER